MVAETNQSYLNTLVTSIGSSYPQLRGKHKKYQEENDQTRQFIKISPEDDKVKFSSLKRDKAENKSLVDASKKFKELTDEEKREIASLKEHDHKVHTHEQAHMAIGRDLVIGGPSYEYKTAPDGKRTAVGGEVSIDTSEVDDDPPATILKAGQFRQTALAPADPSAQDRAVAAETATMAFRAQVELSKQKSATKNKSQNQTSHIDLFV